MRKNSNIKKIIGSILMVASFLAIVVCGVAAVILEFKNPDMTDMRMFLTYPWPTIGSFVSLIVGLVGESIYWRA